MTAGETFQDLTARGVTFETNRDGSLAVAGPESVLTDEVATLIETHVARFLEFLRQRAEARRHRNKPAPGLREDGTYVCACSAVILAADTSGLCWNCAARVPSKRMCPGRCARFRKAKPRNSSRGSSTPRWPSGQPPIGTPWPGQDG